MAAALAFTEDELDHMGDAMDDWPNMSRAERTAFKEAATTQFLTARNLDVNNVWYRSAMRSRISVWISNHADSDGTRLPKWVKTDWSGRDVWTERNRQAIKARRNEIMQERNKPSIAAYNLARHELWTNLSAADKERYESTAEEWTHDGPDEDIVHSMADKRGPGWSHSYAVLQWTQARTYILQVQVHKNREGKIVMSPYTTSQAVTDIGVPDFSDLYPRWHAALLDKALKYGKRLFFGEVDENAAVPPDKSSDVVIEYDEYDFPVLPYLVDGREITQNTVRQKNLHAYLTAHWRRACAIPDSVSCRVPWGRIERSPDVYIPPDMFPDGAVFRDPYRMPHKQLAPLWDEVVRRHRLPADQADPWHFSHVWMAKNVIPARYGEDPEPVVRRSGRAGKREREREANARREREAAAWSGEAQGVRLTEQAGPQGSGLKKTKSPKRNFGPRGGSSLKKGGKRKHKDSKGAGTRRRRRRMGLENPVETSQSEDEDFWEDENGSTSPEDISDDEQDVPESSGQSAGKTLAERRGGGVKPRPINPPQTSLAVPPDETTVESARNQPPSWALRRRCFLPYLWGLARDGEYRALVAAWRHTLHRTETIPVYNDGVTDWATWSFEATNVPERVHTSPRRTRWTKLLEWLGDMCPTPNTGAGEIQKFLLVAGMVIRDIHIVNSIEDDAEVPQGGAEYLRHSQSSFGDLTTQVYPLLQRAHCPVIAEELPKRAPTRSSSADEVRNLIDEPMNVDMSTPSLQSLPSERTPGIAAGSSAGPSTTRADENSDDPRGRDQRDGGSAVSSTALLAVTLPLGSRQTDGPQADHARRGPQTAGEPDDVASGASLAANGSPSVRHSGAEVSGQSLATTSIEKSPPGSGPTKAAQKNANKRGGRKKGRDTVPDNEAPPPDLKGKGKAVDIPPAEEPAQLPLPKAPLRASKRVRKQPP